MTVASELILSNGTTPATPGAGKVVLFFDSTSSPPYPSVIDSTGTVYLVGVATLRPATNDFRLTGVTATPIMTADSTALSTIYLTPFKGAGIALYNGSGWDLLTSAEVSLAVTARTTDLPFDIFAYNNAGTVTLEFLDWTNATTRATALVRQDGVWSKTGALTRRYMGSCRARSATSFHWVESGSDSPAKFDLFNADNRVRVPFKQIATTNTWTYTTATWRQSQGSTNYQVDIMVGLQEEAFQIQLHATASNTTAAIGRYAGIGYDSTTAISGTTTNLVNLVSASGDTFQTTHVGNIANLPTIGRHFYAWLEISVATGTTTWYGDNGALLLQSGMTGTWAC